MSTLTGLVKRPTRSKTMSEAPVAPDKVRHHLLQVQGLKLEKPSFFSRAIAPTRHENTAHEVSNKGAKTSQTSKNIHFCSCCFQALFRTAFLKDVDANCPKNVTNMVGKTLNFRGHVENGKLRFDCAGACGSRVRPSRKHSKSVEKTTLRTYTPHALAF